MLPLGRNWNRGGLSPISVESSRPLRISLYSYRGAIRLKIDHAARLAGNDCKGAAHGYDGYKIPRRLR
jgi:hypothetical protein